MPERPYRVVDWHGEVVADELDDVPPLLTQREVDCLAAHLEDTQITETAVWSALKKLPDYPHGSGAIGDVRPSCQKCRETISEKELFETAFGYFYHSSCLEEASDAKGKSAKYEKNR